MLNKHERETLSNLINDVRLAKETLEETDSFLTGQGILTDCEKFLTKMLLLAENGNSEDSPQKVKKIDWKGPFCGIWEGGYRFEGDTPLYQIIWDLGRSHDKNYAVYVGKQRIGEFNTIEAAQKVCQTDFTHRTYENLI